MLVKCQCCDKLFNKFPKEIKKSQNHFCSRSCAAKINNKKFKKRKNVKNFCACGKEIHKHTITCLSCIKNKSKEKWAKETIGDKIYDKHKYAKYAYIRFAAKSVAKENNMTKCKNCGYEKHVEICHIKAIHTFPKETFISKVNDISNLIALCPNCHWEFDHGDLTFDQINKK